MFCPYKFQELNPCLCQGWRDSTDRYRCGNQSTLKLHSWVGNKKSGALFCLSIVRKLFLTFVCEITMVSGARHEKDQNLIKFVKKAFDASFSRASPALLGFTP